LIRIHTKIHTAVATLHPSWDLLAQHSVFLQKSYLDFLASNTPHNMACFFVEFFVENQLEGIALLQSIHLKKFDFLGQKENGLKKIAQECLVKQLVGTTIVIGNNMLSGEHAFWFSDKLKLADGLNELLKTINLLKANIKKSQSNVKLITIKDFEHNAAKPIKEILKKNWYCFESQPNMVFYCQANWLNFEDYIAALTKKYRDQYKRCRKKGASLTKKKLSQSDLVLLKKEMHLLYMNVVNQASFNTFILDEHHFSELKNYLGEDFLVYGYFENEQLIGFNTLIKNGHVMETYFLGYDADFQREKMLYLNMLYDMVAFSINQGFQKINFGRTALEIKSSIGAEAVPLYGFMQHQSNYIQKCIPKLFGFIEPNVNWQKRNPFKDFS
jgi:hypothetical protein